jgi:hypothetical protein
MAYLFFFLYSVFGFSLETPALQKTNVEKSTEKSTYKFTDKSTDKFTQTVLEQQLTDQQLHELARHPLWLRLLHYDKPRRSKVNKPDFFVSNDSRANSTVELKSFLAGLQNSTVNNDHVLCRFPARSLFVYQQLAPGQQPNFAPCTKLNDFIERTAINSVSVVFSSYYLHNPSSAFGHTLLKINRKANDDDLLNYGINFAATVDTSNAILYAIKGFSGFFHGEFTAVPYYYKVREYNDFESRDLWSYKLNLTSDEKNLLLHHIWELGNVWAPYYYLDENCSYWILRILEASSPRLNLIKHLPSTHTIPIDTVRALYKQADLVESFDLRPSLRKKVARRFSLLAPEEIETVKQSVEDLREKKLEPENLSVLKNTSQVDAALDYFDYKNAKLAGANEKEFEALKRPLLIRRSQLKDPPTPLNFTDEVPPHKFHPSGMVSLGGGVQANDNPFVAFRFKPALHDLIDPHQGFDFSSEINFLDSEFRFLQKDNDKWTAKVHKVDIVRVGVLTPMDQIDMKAAWRFNTGLQPFAQKKSQRESSIFFALAPGLSVYTPWTQQKSITYFLLHSEVNQLSSLNHDAAVRMGPTVGALTSLTSHFKIALDFKYLFDYQFTSHWDEMALLRLQAQYYFAGADMALMTDLDVWDEFAEVGLSFRYYF